MTSIGLREKVPQNAICIQYDGQVPTDWEKASSFYGKFIRGTSTTPGATEGALTHTHSADGDHSHAITDPTDHTHTLTTNGVGSYQGGDNGNVQDVSNGTHTHTLVTDSSSPSASTSTDGSHTHSADTNEPSHLTQFFLKKTGSIGLRRKGLARNSIFLWGKVESALPARYASDANFDNRHIKGVSGAGSTPNEDLGTDTHQHDAAPNHTHTVSLAAHSHTTSVISSTESASVNPSVKYGFSGVNSWSAHGHYHGNGTAQADSGGTGGSTSEEGTSGQHPLLNHEPAYKSIIFVKQQSIGMRQNGLPPGAMLIWEDSIASIPTKWQNGDGTNGTFNMVDKYPRGEAGSTPGTTGGSNTHQHSAPAGHGHAAKATAHNHTQSGATGVASGYYSDNTGTDDTSAPAYNHAHSLSGNSSSDGPTLSLDTITDTHTHDSVNNQPPTIRVAFIERLTP